MVFKAVRLDEITKRVSFKREEVQRLHLMTLEMVRIRFESYFCNFPKNLKQGNYAL